MLDTYACANWHWAIYRIYRNFSTFLIIKLVAVPSFINYLRKIGEVDCMVNERQVYDVLTVPSETRIYNNFNVHTGNHNQFDDPKNIGFSRNNLFTICLKLLNKSVLKGVQFVYMRKTFIKSISFFLFTQYSPYNIFPSLLVECINRLWTSNA